MEPIEPTPVAASEAQPAAGTSSTAARLWRHRGLLARGFAALLVTVVVLQNLEHTQVDVLFWSFLAVPKLVLILVSMGVGAAGWEIARRALFPAKARGVEGA